MASEIFDTHMFPENEDEDADFASRDSSCKSLSLHALALSVSAKPPSGSALVSMGYNTLAAISRKRPET